MAVKDTVETIVKGGESVVTKIIDAVGPAIASLAESLGTTAREVMVILTKQSITDGIGSLITSVILICVAIACYKGMRWAFSNVDLLDDAIIPICIIGVVGIVLGIAVGLGELVTGIKHLMNPEYYALKEVMEFVENFKK